MPIILKPKEPSNNGGGSGGESYDDTVIKSRVSNAEGEIATLQETKADKTELAPFATKAEIPSAATFSTKQELSTVEEKTVELESKISNLSNVLKPGQIVETYAELNALTDLEDWSVHIVKNDENSSNRRMMYIYNGSAFVESGEANIENYDDTALMQAITNLQNTKADRSEIPVMPDLSPYALKTQIPAPIDTSQFATKTDLENIDVPDIDLTDYVTKAELDNLNFEVDIPANVMKSFPNFSQFNLTKEGEIGYDAATKTFYRRNYDEGSAPTELFKNVVPVMTKNEENGVIVSSINGTPTTGDLWNAFDGNDTTYYSGVYWNYLTIAFDTPIKFAKFKMMLQNVPQSYKVDVFQDGIRVNVIPTTNFGGVKLIEKELSQEYENVEKVEIYFGTTATLKTVGINTIEIMENAAVSEYTEIAKISDIDLSALTTKEEIEKINEENTKTKNRIKVLESFHKEITIDDTKDLLPQFPVRTTATGTDGEYEIIAPYYSTYYAYQALNNNGHTSGWLIRTDSTPLPVNYDIVFPVDKAIGGLSLTGMMSLARSVKTFEIHVSRDYDKTSKSGTFEFVQRFENINWADYTKAQKFMFDEVPEEVKAVRLKLFENHGDATFIGIGEIELFEAVVKVKDNSSSTAKSNGLMKFNESVGTTILNTSGSRALQYNGDIDLITNNGVFNPSTERIRVPKEGYYKVFTNFGVTGSKKGDQFTLKLGQMTIDRFTIPNDLGTDKFNSHQTAIVYLSHTVDYHFVVDYTLIAGSSSGKIDATNSTVYIEEV